MCLICQLGTHDPGRAVAAFTQRVGVGASRDGNARRLPKTTEGSRTPPGIVGESDARRKRG